MADNLGAVEVRIKSSIDDALRKMDKASQQFVTMAGFYYVNEVKALMRTSPRGGRVYRRIRVSGLRGRLLGKKVGDRDYITHRASAPGEPPAIDKGNLVNSVASVEELTPRGWATTGGSLLAKIPAALEYGTATIAARPAFIPALMNIRPQLVEAAKRAFADLGR